MEIKNLSFSYNNKEDIFSNLNLKFEKGRSYALFGKSGCGKSTLLRIIHGLLKSSSGTIDIRSQSRSTLVFQDARLLPWRTALKNVEFALENQGLSKQEIRLRAQAALEKVSALDLENLYPRQLSGGQKQRISFARALVTNPDVLLMDEAFSALDSESKSDLYMLVDQLQKQNVTIILVTHDYTEALRLADEIIYMQDSGPIFDKIAY